MKSFARSLPWIAAAIAALPGCGPKLTSTAKNTYVRTIVADASMRQVMNSKWTCSHSDAPDSAKLPYRSLTIFNEAGSQSLQLAIHYLDTEVPTVDLVQIDDLQCFYSTADAHVLKCGNAADPSLRIETSIQDDYDRKSERLLLTMSGAERSFSVYLGGRENRRGTLAEFKQRYRDPFTIVLLAPDKCGFE